MKNDANAGTIVTKRDESISKLARSLDGFVDEEQIKVIHETVAKGTTLTELAYFLNVARSVGLNPFNKEIWCYKDNKGNLVMFAGRDGFLKKAQENPKFTGIRSSEVKANDEFSIDIANNHISHKISNLKDRGEIVGGYAIVFREGGEPTIVVVEFARYNKPNGYSAWKSHPEDMIKKVAESKALKLAFGISNLQVEEEFEIKNGVAVPSEGSVEQADKRKLSDKEFKQFISQPNDYIEKYESKFEFTDEQQKQLAVRKGEHA